MSHAAQATTTAKHRVVSRPGRPSARVEERIAGEMDKKAISLDISRELTEIYHAEALELRSCRHLERELCDSCRRIKVLHDRVDAIGVAAVANCTALCNGEKLA